MTSPETGLPGCAVAPDGTARFTYRDGGASAVLVAGDFTRWAEGAIPLSRTPGTFLWVGRTPPLPRGVHGYKYVVDGRWIQDPAHPLDVDDGFGGKNSAFVVGLRELGSPAAVRVLSLNLHTYQERSARGQSDALEKLAQIAFGAAAAGVDLLLLQEVGEHVSSPSHPNAGAVLMRHLERLTRKRWSHEWREAHIGFDVYREGLSILAAGPMDDVTKIALGGAPLDRIALSAIATVKGVRLRVVTTHVGWGSEGGDQVALLVDELRRKPGDHMATLVTGDFNAGPTEPQVATLVGSGYVEVGASRGATFPTFGDGNGDRPRGLDRRIDYHFLRATAGRGAPRVDAFQRVFDGAPPEDGLHPRVSDHAGIFAAYSLV